MYPDATDSLNECDNTDLNLALEFSDMNTNIIYRIQHLKVGPHHTVVADCQELNAGMLSFHKLSRLYPGHLYFMRYEDMSRNPIGE